MQQESYDYLKWALKNERISPVSPLGRVINYLIQRHDQPMSGNSHEIHNIHNGTKFAACLSAYDLANLVYTMTGEHRIAYEEWKKETDSLIDKLKQ